MGVAPLLLGSYRYNCAFKQGSGDRHGLKHGVASLKGPITVPFKKGSGDRHSLKHGVASFKGPITVPFKEGSGTDIASNMGSPLLRVL